MQVEASVPAAWAWAENIDRFARTGQTDVELWERAADGSWSQTLTFGDTLEFPRAFSGDGNTLVSFCVASGPQLWDLLIRDLTSGAAVVASYPLQGGILARPPAIDFAGERFVLHLNNGVTPVQVIDRNGNLIADNHEAKFTSAVATSDDLRFIAIHGTGGQVILKEFAMMLDLEQGPLPFCTPKPSSAACWTLLQAGPAANPTSGANDFDVEADFVHPQKVGLFFFGLSGPTAAPFLGGTLCVAPPLGRTPPQFSGGTAAVACDGHFSLVLNDGLSPFDPGPNGKVWVQAWYRDPLNGPGSLGTALSNALEITFD